MTVKLQPQPNDRWLAKKLVSFLNHRRKPLLSYFGLCSTKLLVKKEEQNAKLQAQLDATIGAYTAVIEDYKKFYPKISPDYEVGRAHRLDEMTGDLIHTIRLDFQPLRYSYVSSRFPMDKSELNSFTYNMVYRATEELGKEYGKQCAIKIREVMFKDGYQVPDHR